MGKWKEHELGHLRQILKYYWGHSVLTMAEMAQDKIKKRSVNAIAHKLRELISEQEFKEKEITLNGQTFPAQVVSGYIVITLPDETKIPAHIWVWEQEYGKIPIGYHLHHINGNRTDNRLINLTLMSAPDHIALHSGTRPPETAALFWFLQEKGLWNEYLNYRENILNKIVNELK